MSPRSEEFLAEARTRLAAAPESVSHPATRLLEDLPELEQHLLSERFGEEVAAFRPVAWSESAAVHLERLRDSSKRFGAAFPSDLTIAPSGAVAADLPARREEMRRLLSPDDRDIPDPVLDDLALNVLGGMVVTAPERAGATVTSPPGEALRIRHPAGDLNPWALLGPIAAGEPGPSGWKEHPVVQALGDRPLRASPDGL